MSFKRFGEWLLTEKGRSFSMGCATAGAIALFAIKALPNTVFIENYKEVVHLYKDGMTVKLSDTLKKRFEKAVDLVGIKKDERTLFQPFPVFGFDTFSAGTSYSKFGAIIGMPVNFTYKDVDTIDKMSIKVNQESVPWELDEANELLDSYVLSENAQIYAIAREIKMADSMKMVLDSTNVLVTASLCYGLGNFMNEKLNLYSKPRQIRLFMYVLTTSFSILLYFFIKDFNQIHYEKYVDGFLKEKDPIFAEGGKEYYEKMLQRNRAVRKLLGKEGESMFSVLGNENFFIRQKHLPLIHRKEFFETATETL